MRQCEKLSTNHRLKSVFFLKTELQKLDFLVYEFWSQFSLVLDNRYPTFSSGFAQP